MLLMVLRGNVSGLGVQGGGNDLEGGESLTTKDFTNSRSSSTPRPGFSSPPSTVVLHLNATVGYSLRNTSNQPTTDSIGTRSILFNTNTNFTDFELVAFSLFTASSIAPARTGLRASKISKITSEVQQTFFSSRSAVNCFMICAMHASELEDSFKNSSFGASFASLASPPKTQCRSMDDQSIPFSPDPNTKSHRRQLHPLK